MNGYLNKLLSTEDVDYVIASDTDSIYLNFGPIVDKFLGDKVSDTSKVVSVSYTHLTLPTNREV